MATDGRRDRAACQRPDTELNNNDGGGGDSGPCPPGAGDHSDSPARGGCISVRGLVFITPRLNQQRHSWSAAELFKLGAERFAFAQGGDDEGMVGAEGAGFDAANNAVGSVWLIFAVEVRAEDATGEAVTLETGVDQGDPNGIERGQLGGGVETPGLWRLGQGRGGHGRWWWGGTGGQERNGEQERGGVHGAPGSVV